MSQQKHFLQAFAPHNRDGWVCVCGWETYPMGERQAVAAHDRSYGVEHNCADWTALWDGRCPCGEPSPNAQPKPDENPKDTNHG